MPRRPKPNEDERTEEEIREDMMQRRDNVRYDIWTRDDTGHDLTMEEALFVRSYIIDRNPVAAMRRLNYAGEAQTLRYRADRYLSNVEVQGAIETLGKKMMADLEVTADRVNRQLAAMAFFDPRSVMQFDGVSLRVLDSSLWSDTQIASIRGIKMTKDAGVEIQFVDKLRALEVLGKQLNLLQDPDVLAAKQLAEAAAEGAMRKIAEVFDRMSDNKTPAALPSADTPTIQ
jgi:phage terminase small subunit